MNFQSSHQEKFECWLMEMDESVDRFIDALSPDIKARLDYSPQSLSSVEGWLLANYADVEQLISPSEAKVVDGAARYIGEVFRRNLKGGTWFIDFEDRKNAFYGLPQLKGLPGQTVQVCPLTLVTASADRRTGNFLTTVFSNNLKNAEGIEGIGRE